MNHCSDHTPLVERVAVVEVRCKSNEAFTQDVHDDHEKTKSRVNANEKDILKIKTTVAIYSGIGATLATVAIKLLSVIVKTSWVKQSFFTVELSGEWFSQTTMQELKGVIMNQFLSEAGKMLFPLITSIAMGALKSVLNGMWKAFWQTILDAIAEAEKNWNDGFIKKEYVISSIMNFVEKHKRLNGVQRWAVKRLVGNVVDKIIEDLNKNKGKRWVAVVQDLERELNNKLKIIDPVY